MGRKNPNVDEHLLAVEAKMMKCPGGHPLPNHTMHGKCTPLWCGLGKTRLNQKEPGRVRKERSVRAAAKREAGVLPPLEGGPSIRQTNPLDKGQPSLPEGAVDVAVALSEGGAEETRRLAPAARPAEEGEGKGRKGRWGGARSPGVGDRAESLEAVESTARTAESQLVAKGKGRFTARMQALGVPPGLTGQAAEDFADRKLVELLPLAIAEVEFQLKFGDASQRDRSAERVLNATGRGKREALGNTGPTIILLGGGDSGRVAVPWAQRQPRSDAVVVETGKLPPDGGGGS